MGDSTFEQGNSLPNPEQHHSFMVDAYEGYVWLTFAINHPDAYLQDEINAQRLSGIPESEIKAVPLPHDAHGVAALLQARLNFILAMTGLTTGFDFEGTLSGEKLRQLQEMLDTTEAAAKADSADLFAVDPALQNLGNPFDDPEVLSFLVAQRYHRTPRLLPLNKLAPNYSLHVETA